MSKYFGQYIVDNINFFNYKARHKRVHWFNDIVVKSN